MNWLLASKKFIVLVCQKPMVSWLMFWASPPILNLVVGMVSCKFVTFPWQLPFSIVLCFLPRGSSESLLSPLTAAHSWVGLQPTGDSTQWRKPPASYPLVRQFWRAVLCASQEVLGKLSWLLIAATFTLCSCIIFYTLLSFPHSFSLASSSKWPGHTCVAVLGYAFEGNQGIKVSVGKKPQMQPLRWLTSQMATRIRPSALGITIANR